MLSLSSLLISLSHLEGDEGSQSLSPQTSGHYICHQNWVWHMRKPKETKKRNLKVTSFIVIIMRLAQWSCLASSFGLSFVSSVWTRTPLLSVACLPSMQKKKKGTNAKALALALITSPEDSYDVPQWIYVINTTFHF